MDNKTKYDDGVLVCAKHKAIIQKQNGVFFCHKCQQDIASNRIKKHSLIKKEQD